MRHTDCYRLAKVLLPRMQGFVTDRKNMLFLAPIGDVLRGFLFESTAGSREDFYFWWFFMPIGRPIECVTLSFGARLDVPHRNVGWLLDMEDLPELLMEAMQPKALPVLRSIRGPQDAIEAIRDRRYSKQATSPSLLRSLRHPLDTIGAIYNRRTRQVTDINDQDDLACLMILEGQYEEAARMLERIVSREDGSDRRQWILDIIERMKGLQAQLLKDPQLAVAQVRQWQDYTFKALKLGRWRTSIAP